MFRLDVLETDAFMDMPLTTQALYFHLNLRADDDGFIGNPNQIIRSIGASGDDLKLLIAKRFVLIFEDGVIVIKHWRLHNTLSMNRYKETNFLEDKALLRIKDNNSYTFDENCPMIKDEKYIESSNRQTKDKQKTNKRQQKTYPDKNSIDKNSIDKNSIDKNNILSNTNVLDCPSEKPRNASYGWLIDAWNELKQFGIAPITRITEGSKRITNVRARINQYGKEAMLEAIGNIKISDFLQGKHTGKPWRITFDWFILPTNFPKVLEGNYNNDAGDRKLQETNNESAYSEYAKDLYGKLGIKL